MRLGESCDTPGRGWVQPVFGDEEEEEEEEETELEDEVGNDNIEDMTNPEDSDLDDTELQEMLQETNTPPPAFLNEDSEYPEHDAHCPLPPRRSGRTSRPPSRVGEYAAQMTVAERKTYVQAIAGEY